MRVSLERNRNSFMIKTSSKDKSTQRGYVVAINNLENFCLEKYAKADFIPELKESTDEQIFDFLQAWINWNKDRNPRTVKVLFSRIKKYLHYRGIKLDIQDIKEELDFPRIFDEELYPMTLDDIHKVTNQMQYAQRTQFICQLSSLMRIGELVQLRKKYLISDKENIIVKIPPSIAKFRKGRTTFFSKEASKLLKPLLRKMKDDDLVFGTSENVLYSEINSEQMLKRNLLKVGLDMRYESNNRFYINTHSFRAYGITKLSRHDPNFAKKIAGQKGYLLQYDRMDDDEKLELYQKFEVDLIIDNTEKLKLENKKKQEEITDLQEKNQRIDALEKAQKETMNRLDDMSADVTNRLNSDLDENKEMNENDFKLFAQIVKMKMKTNPEYSEMIKKTLYKKGLSEEANRMISEL